MKNSVALLTFLAASSVRLCRRSHCRATHLEHSIVLDLLTEPVLLTLRNYTAASDASKSAIRSSMSSMPIDRRTVSSDTPALSSS